MHGAPEPAIEVFSKGLRMFPRSSRMTLGAAVALYAKGNYSQAAQRFFEASDLDPADPVAYLFLGKVQSAEITQAPGFLNRLARFAKLQPENAWANYYYAVNLSKQPGESDKQEKRNQVQFLLEKAVRLDPKLAAAHFQLGILYSGKNDLPQAIRAYRQAIEADPQMEQAHYRLAGAYRQTGELQKARAEMDLFRQLLKTSQEQLQRERSELQQFVVTLKQPAPN
jgi:tetratricopeptide (TPR) repeat protein